MIESQNKLIKIGFILLIALIAGGVVGAIVLFQHRKRSHSGVKAAYPVPAPILPSQPTAAQIIGIQGALKGQRISIFDSFLIGRSSECDLKLSDPKISRLHAKLRFALNSWYLQDQGSQSGTLVNGAWIDSAKLEDGDRIRFADFEFEFRTNA